MTCCLRCMHKLAQPEHSFSGGSAGVTTCTILHVSLKWTWEIYSTPQLRVLRKHFEEFWIYLCLEYGVALSNFHSFLFSGKWDAICGWQCKWPRLPTQRKRLPNSMRCQQSLWPKGHPWEHPRLQDVKGPSRYLRCVELLSLSRLWSQAYSLWSKIVK